MSPVVMKLLEAFAACAQEDANVADELAHLRRMLEHVLQQNHRLLQLVRTILEQTTTDPAQLAELKALADQADAATVRYQAATAEAVQPQPGP